jgi:hypothetical protein
MMLLAGGEKGQLETRLIRNQQVVRWSPTGGSKKPFKFKQKLRPVRGSLIERARRVQYACTARAQLAQLLAPTVAAPTNAA